MNIQENETQVRIESEFNKLNFSDRFQSICDPRRIIEEWSSGNQDIDKFIKDTMYDTRQQGYSFLEWVPFEKFEDIKQVDEAEFTKVNSKKENNFI